MATMRPPRPLAASNSNPFASVLNEDSHDNVVEKQRVSTDDEDGARDDVSDSESSYESNNEETRQRRRQKPPRPSTAAAHRMAALTASAKRRRRRSSARFMQLGGGGGSRGSIGAGGDGDDDDGEDARASANGRQGEGEGNLSELYQKAIRMNAENKINAVNSWNLRLIENIDQFLEMDDEDDGAGAAVTTPVNAAAAVSANVGDGAAPSTNNNKRVNFTKASCTLDASVKIYSYRVDDVHLTSYKVLANLNRTNNNDTTKPPPANSNNRSSGADGVDDDDNNGDGEPNNKEKRGSKSSGSTLETHIANINLNKLDAAFDIDPLFHKMSKTFDEGGAKGLLLVNLGVGENGCNIIFDSSHDNDDVEVHAAASAASDDKPPRLPEGMMDVTSLTAKLEALLQEQQRDDNDDEEAGCTISALPLVPQLAALRAEHQALEDGGFVEHGAAALAATVGPKTPAGKKRRYHADDKEEREADYSIHKEAMERSRLSASHSLSMRLGLDSPTDGGGAAEHANYNSTYVDDDDDDACVDFGGGCYDDGDDDNGFDAFIATAGARYSDVSFTSGEAAGAFAAAAQPDSAKKTTTTTTASLIDAIASGVTVLSTSDYEYFTKASGGNGGDTGNLWAGAAHWKRANLTGKKDAGAGSNNKKKKAAKGAPKQSAKNNSRERALVSLDSAPDLSHLLVATAARAGSSSSSKRRVVSTTQLSRAAITKHTNQLNLLPEDAGFRVEQLTELFLRPNAVLKQQRLDAGADAGAAVSTPVVCGGGGKTVGFNLPDWADDDGSYGGGGDDGPGFDFGGADDDDDDDEFLVQELEGVRKVEKVRVGYAVVAKKVDVKRLKRDLWNELESKFGCNGDSYNGGGGDDDDDVKSNCEGKEEEESNEQQHREERSETAVSFQDAVRELELQKSQMDVTLPFYFICILHLANEKGLRLESHGLEDFTIHQEQHSDIACSSQLF